MFKVVRQDNGIMGSVVKPWSPFESETQIVQTVCGRWEKELFWRGKLNDDGWVRWLLDLIDEFRNSLITRDGTEPVLEGRVIDLAILLENVRRFQDHDPLSVVGMLVGRAILAHGV
jgi:hypothetical protein